MLKVKKSTSIMITVLMILSLSLTAFANPAAFDRGISSRVDIDRMMDQLTYLTEDIGVRVASTPEEKEAAEWIADMFEKYGYTAEIQEFEYINRVAYLTVTEPEEVQIDVQIGGTRLEGHFAAAPLTSEEGITAKVVDCGFGHIDEFPAEVEGNIALIRRGQNTFANMLVRAEAAGASALLIQNNDWRIFKANVSGASIPYATMNDEAGELLRGEEEIMVNLKTLQYDTSQNVIATRKPNNKNRDTGNVVVYSAHYDTVPTAPGASDNGSGVVGMLELARILSSMPIDTEVRFLAAGAEEVGLVGSRYYVAQLSEDEIDRTIANYNMDMIGTAGEAQTTLFVNTLDGDNLVSRTAREAAERLGYSDLVRAPFHRGASDHVAFFEVGIDAANFIYRCPDTIALEPWYHQPLDTMDKISPERLQMAVEIIAAASYDVVRPATPNLIRSKIRKDTVKPADVQYQDNEMILKVPEM